MHTNKLLSGMITMNARTFVNCWKKERDTALDLYTSGKEVTAVSELIKEMQLTPAQSEKMGAVLDTVLTDAYYSLLIGLSGGGSIGGIQQSYKILDEDGNTIDEDDEIESEAWEAFHEE
jgi:hypothetical protein